jgi:hypothetical protein
MGVLNFWLLPLTARFQDRLKIQVFDTQVIAEHAILKNPPEVPIFRVFVSFDNRNLTIP